MYSQDLNQLKATRLLAERMGVLWFWSRWLHIKAVPDSNCNQGPSSTWHMSHNTPNGFTEAGMWVCQLNMGAHFDRVWDRVCVFHLFPHWFIPLYSHLPPTPPQPALLCCLLGNTCHSILPQLTRPTPGRTQASPDVKPLLPFHLLPHFTDVSTVSLHL